MVSKNVRRTISMVLVLLMVCSSMLFAKGTDYLGHWAEASIQNWIDKGYIKGYPDGTFKPENDITRAEFMTIVNRSFEFTAEAEVSYKDVNASHWAYIEFKRANAAGYIGGFEDGTLRPNNKITREEVAVIITRLLSLKEEKDSKAFLDLKDFKQVPDWSSGAVSAIVDKGYMKLRGKDFAPKLPATRAEVIDVLNRGYLNLIKIKYNEAGTYTAGIVDGSIEINAKDVILEDTTINGNLIIGEAVGSGNVTLKNVIVKGDTIVRGGGINSIIIEDSEIINLIIEKIDGKVRILAKRSTYIHKVDMRSGGKLEARDQDANNFGYIVIAENLSSDEPIILVGNFKNIEVKSGDNEIQIQGGTIKNLVIANTAKGAKVNLASGAKVDAVEINAAARIDGKGKIGTARVNVEGVEIIEPLGEMIKADGVNEVEIIKPIFSGGGGGGGGGLPPSVEVSAININKSTTTLVEGTTETLTVTFTPSNASNKTITWTTSDASKATIDSTGKVRAVSAGTATITAKSNNGKTATCVVTVTTTVVPVSAISVDKTTLTLTAGGATETITATVLPAGATNKSVTWATSNNAVATVVNGVVTPKTAGTATITVKTVDGGYTATVEVVVAAAADVEITAFDAIANVDAGKAGSATYADAAAVIAALPTDVTANLNAVTVPVTTWVDTDSYDPAVAGSYTFTATLGAIPAGFANTGGYTATVEVVVAAAADVEITAFDAIADKDGGKVGAATYADAAAVIAALPTNVTANLNAVTVPVTTWVDTDSYDPAVAGSYTFTATLGAIPAGFANTGGYTATVEVVVAAAADVEITAFDAIANVDAGKAGSATYADAAAVIAALPTNVTANLNAVTVPVTTWVDTDSYDPAVAGSYTFTATLGAIPAGFANTGGYTATVEVVVAAAADVEITAFDAIANVDAGKAGSATYADAAAVIAALPTNVTANSNAVTVPVTTWVDTDSYDPAVAGSYTFTATLGAIPAGFANTGGYTATVKVVVAAAADVEITAFDAIANVDAGKAGSATYADATAVIAALPTDVTANSNAVTVPVTTWVDTDSYDPAVAGSYTFTATLGAIPAGFANTGGYTATVKVVVAAAADVEITAFDAIANVDAGKAGSATYADATAVIAALPTNVTANSNAVTVPVTTWVDTDSYDPAVAGSYTFTATLGAIPAGFANTGGYTATVKVVVAAAADVEITAFDAIANVDAGKAGSATYADATAVIAALPTNVTANSNAVTVPVTTWVDTDSYDPAVAGSYTFTATLGAIPAGFANTGGYTATVKVVVAAAADVEITAFDAIANVDAGKAGSATYADETAVIAALPTDVTANSNAVTVPVTTWVDTDSYDPAVAGSYTFTATLGAIPAGFANTGGYTATVEVVVAAAADVEITAFDAIANVDAGKAGSATYADATAVIAALPTDVTANSNAVTVPVTTWVDTDSYDPAVAGSYTFTATLGAIPAGFANTGGYTATVKVVVAAAADVEITAFDAIANVDAGKVGSATYADATAVIAALPTDVTANSNAVTVPVTTWVDTDSYDPAVAGSYTFTATLGAIPAGFANTGGYTATVEVTVEDRAKITNVVATSTIKAPVYGETIENPTFTITEGSPAHLDSSKSWQKKIAGNWENVTSGKFTEGIWRFRCQVRIDDKVFDENDGTTHKLAYPLKVMVGGDVWLENGTPSIYDTFSNGWVYSLEYEVIAPEGTELTFNTPSYSVPLKISGQSITPYSVASFAEGGKKPYKFSKTSGPEWITVSEAGEISGTPTTAGPNSDLVIRVTDESDDYKEITINVGKTVINPSDRIDVTNVVATSNIEAPVYDKTIVNPTFTITEGSPAHLDASKYWQKKIDGNWENVPSGKFIEGIWRFRCQVRIDDKVFDENDGTTHKLASPLTVTVNDTKWLENGTPSIYDTFSFNWVYSPEYEVTNP